MERNLKEQMTEKVIDIVGERLIPTERTALGNLLGACHEEDEYDGPICAEYRGAVDFLWMAHRISIDEKLRLLDLLDNLMLEEE